MSLISVIFLLGQILYTKVMESTVLNKVRRLFTLILVLLMLNPVYSASLNQILKSAENNSPEYRNYEITYRDGLLTLSEMESKDLPSLSFSLSTNPYSYTNISGNSESSSITLTPSFTYQSADGSTKVGAKVGYGQSYTSKGSLSVSPSLNLSHNFDFSGYSDTVLDDINYSSSSLTVNYNKALNELSFRKTVLTLIRQVYSTLKNLEDAQYNLDNMKTEFENMKKLKTYSETSNTYIETENALQYAQNIVDALIEQKENALENYRTFTGLEWDGIDEIPEPVLNVRILKTGNTSVLLKSLEAQKAEEEYKKAYAQIYPNNMTLGVGVSGVYSKDPVLGSSTAVKGNAGISYQGKNWSLSAEPELSYTNSPNSSYISGGGITITATVTNNANDISEKTRLSSLQNSSLIKQNAYVQALTSYNQQGQNYNLSVMRWNFSRAQQESSYALDKAKYETQKSLYEKGLISKSDFDKSEHQLNLDEYDRIDVLLEGLILECDLSIYAL